MARMKTTSKPPPPEPEPEPEVSIPYKRFHSPSFLTEPKFPRKPRYASMTSTRSYPVWVGGMWKNASSSTSSSLLGRNVPLKSVKQMNSAEEWHDEWIQSHLSEDDEEDDDNEVHADNKRQRMEIDDEEIECESEEALEEIEIVSCPSLVCLLSAQYYAPLSVIL
jgi:hypothetical protein